MNSVSSAGCAFVCTFLLVTDAQAHDPDIPSLTELLERGVPEAMPGTAEDPRSAPLEALADPAQEPGPAAAAPGDEGHGAAHGSSDAFHFTTIRTWAYRDFLPDDDHTDVLGFEFNSAWGWGSFDVANISYFEVAQYPRAVPGKPGGNPIQPGDLEAADGITDLLTALLFSKQGAHEGPHHFALGAAAQLPTASDEILGSGKWSAGPAVEYEYHRDRFYAAFVALQLWSFAGDSDRKEVNMLMVKPMLTYELDPRWKLVYMPYGISQYWNKPSGQRLYVPLGGGVQYGFKVKGLDMATSLQFFNYTVRPDDGSQNEIRFMLELDL